MIPGFEETLKNMLEIAKAKNADYAGKDGDPFKNFELVEHMGIASVEQGILTRLADKFSRVINLIENDPEVKSESITDTCVDAANYFIILKCYLEHKQQLNKEVLKIHELGVNVKELKEQASDLVENEIESQVVLKEEQPDPGELDTVTLLRRDQAVHDCILKIKELIDDRMTIRFPNGHESVTYDANTDTYTITCIPTVCKTQKFCDEASLELIRRIHEDLGMDKSSIIINYNKIEMKRKSPLKPIQCGEAACSEAEGESDGMTFTP